MNLVALSQFVERLPQALSHRTRRATAVHQWNFTEGKPPEPRISNAARRFGQSIDHTGNSAHRQ